MKKKKKLGLKLSLIWNKYRKFGGLQSISIKTKNIQTNKNQKKETF
jgi:hypothetical protein